VLGSAVIVFRETLEAALIVGIIAAATRNMPRRSACLFGGIGAGILGSMIVAALTGQIADLAQGRGQELLNASILGVATLMLAWHNIWMARHGRQLAVDARQLGRDVATGAKAVSALSVVVALAVLREGSETVLFLYGLLVGSEASLATVIGGVALGLILGMIAGYGLYAGVLRIPARHFFAVTSGLIVVLAAAIASQMARFLVQAGLLPSLTAPLWDTSGLLPNDSLTGQVLHTLIGYDARPSGIQVVFYCATLILIVAGMRIFRPRPAEPAPA
jgi:high-affinity iron transporter